MKIFGKIRLILSQGKDFMLYLVGKNYFHLPERPGNYFNDGISYYVEMKGKYHWDGRCEVTTGVPVLYFPEMDKEYVFPSMVIQWGLGAIESYVEFKSKQKLDTIIKCYEWLKVNINKDGVLDNHFQEIDVNGGYTSNKSEMTQGLAISFLVRCGMVPELEIPEKERLEIIKTLIIPILESINNDQRNKNTLYEYFRADNYIVLNGWIFSIFGLIDYIRVVDDQNVKKIINDNIRHLNEIMPKYLKENGWSYYDNKMRISSPVYHDLHICQLSSLDRLNVEYNFKPYIDRMIAANSWLNRTKYTYLKIVDKLFDQYPYSSQK